MATYKVGYFVGSLASTSINRLLSKALVRLAPPELVMSEIPIRDLPLYSADYDADYPPAARDFKQAIADVDAVLFVTPEYNRSIPGGLKNAIAAAVICSARRSRADRPMPMLQRPAQHRAAARPTPAYRRTPLCALRLANRPAPARPGRAATLAPGQDSRGITVSTRAMKACSSFM